MNQSKWDQAERDHEAAWLAREAQDDDTHTVRASLDGTDCDLVCDLESGEVWQVVLGEYVLDIELFSAGIRDRLQQQAHSARREEQDAAEEADAEARAYAMEAA